MSCRLMIEELTDITLLMDLRREVVREVFGHDMSEELYDANRSYYGRHIADGSHVAIIARAGRDIVGCGAVCFHEELPSPDNPSGRCAYLMNIYVREEHRRQGVGHHIVADLIDRAIERDCGKIYLETTRKGKTLYESMGFSVMEGMMSLPGGGKMSYSCGKTDAQRRTT